MSDPRRPLDPDVRSSALRILALPFRYPAQDVLEAFRGGEYEEALRDHAALLPHLAAALERARPALEAARAELASVTLVDAEVAFTGTFVAGMPEPPCPPYEGLVRVLDNRVALMLEVSDFYKCFGLRMNPAEGRNEQPDHLCAELEFLQFLCMKEAQARRDDAAELLHGYVLAQRDFLARHLTVWARPFAERLAKGSRHPWFTACAALLADHLEAEQALTEEYLRQLPAPPAPPREGAKAESRPGARSPGRVEA